MPLDLFDPTQPAQGNEIRYAPRPRDLKGLKVGLVENTKYNSEVLLKKVAERLQRQFGVTMVHLDHKKSAGTPVNETAIREFKTKADFVVAGVGD